MEVFGVGGAGVVRSGGGQRVVGDLVDEPGRPCTVWNGVSTAGFE